MISAIGRTTEVVRPFMEFDRVPAIVQVDCFYQSGFVKTMKFPIDNDTLFVVSFLR